MVQSSVPMIDATLGDAGLAAVTVGLILTEAIVLYVVYGVLTRVAGPTVLKIIEKR